MVGDTSPSPHEGTTVAESMAILSAIGAINLDGLFTDNQTLERFLRNETSSGLGPGEHPVFSLVVEGILMMCVGVFGVVSNITSIVFFLRQKSQKTFHRLLLLLAVTDTLHILCLLLSFSLPYFTPEQFRETYRLYSLPYTLPLAQTSMVMSCYMTISLTVERYISVVHPLLRMTWKSPRWFVYLSLPSLLFSVLFTLPTYFMLNTETVRQDDRLKFLENDSLWSDLVSETSQPRTRFQWAGWRENNHVIMIYVLWLHLIFVTIIPVSLLIWLNRIIYRTLSEQDTFSLRRSGHQTLRRREVRMARVSIAIVCIYILCHTPKIIPSLCEIIYMNSKMTAISGTVKNFIKITHLLLTLNSSLNFPIYFLASGSSLSLALCRLQGRPPPSALWLWPLHSASPPSSPPLSPYPSPSQSHAAFCVTSQDECSTVDTALYSPLLTPVHSISPPVATPGVHIMMAPRRSQGKRLKRLTECENTEVFPGSKRWSVHSV